MDSRVIAAEIVRTLSELPIELGAILSGEHDAPIDIVDQILQKHQEDFKINRARLLLMNTKRLLSQQRGDDRCLAYAAKLGRLLQ